MYENLSWVIRLICTIEVWNHRVTCKSHEFVIKIGTNHRIVSAPDWKLYAVHDCMWEDNFSNQAITKSSCHSFVLKVRINHSFVRACDSKYHDLYTLHHILVLVIMVFWICLQQPKGEATDRPYICYADRLITTFWFDL